jgi:MPBQ/MSBQ methyltransferase
MNLEFENYYKDFFELYDPESKIARDRINNTIAILEKYLKRPDFKNFNRRILDLCCGAGLYSFALEKMGMDVLGLDLQENLLSVARRYGCKIKTKTQFEQSDVRDLNLNCDKFGCAVILGNSITHFTLDDFRKIVKNVYQSIYFDGLLVIEYRDAIQLFMNYEQVRSEGLTKKSIISFHSRYDLNEGYFVRTYYNLTEQKYYDIKFYVWFPSLLRFITNSFGFKLQASEINQETHFILDIFRRR